MVRTAVPIDSNPSHPTEDPADLLRQAQDMRGPQAATLLHRAGLLFLQRKDIAQAVHTLEQAITAIAPLPTVDGQDRTSTAVLSDRPLRARLEYDLGRIFEEEMGRLDGALLHYQRAFKLQPEVTQPLHRGRAIYRDLGDTGMVGRLFELEMNSLGDSRPAEMLALALSFAHLVLRQQRDPARAAAILNSAISQQPSDIELPEEVLETLAEAYVSPDFSAEPDGAPQALRQAGEIYLALALRQLSPGKDPDPSRKDRALSFLRRALGADPTSTAAATELERLYQQQPSPQREIELCRLYRTGARVSRRGLKLLRIYEEREQQGTPISPEDLQAAIAACRAGIEEAETLDEWQETRAALRRLLLQGHDLPGLAGLLEEDAAEAALPDERADLLLGAADLYRKGGDTEKYLLCLRQALREVPLHAEVFRRLSDHYGSRRDFAALAAIHEARLQALLFAEQIDLATHVRQLEELSDLYEKKLQDAAAAADVWRRIDEIQPGQKAQAERRRLGQRLLRMQIQSAELQMELDRTPVSAAGKRADLLRRLGHLYREQHDPQRAAALYEELLLFTPSDVPALKALQEVRELEGDVPGQLDVLRRQVEFAGDRAERLGLLRRMVALSAQETRRPEMMVFAAKGLLSELPSDRDALRRLAEAQERLGDGKGLLDTLEIHVKVAPTPREKLPLHLQAARLLSGQDLERAAQHLLRAARLCPPGPENEAVLVELSRIYGQQGRLQEQLQVLELCLRQNPRSSPETFRMLGRATQVEPRDQGLEEKSLKAWREVLHRLPNDLEAIEALSQLHRARGEWRDLAAVLRRSLDVPDQLPEKRLSVALELADVLCQRFDDRRGALQLLSQIHTETPICDRLLHRRLRILSEDLSEYDRAARYAERELLLTEDPLHRLELAMQIAALWRNRVKDRGRALLSYERVLEILPQAAPESVVAREGRRIIAQAMDAMSEIYAEEEQWRKVVALGDQRLALSQGEPMRAACIMQELAIVCEEKLGDPRAGFDFRRRAFQTAPEMVPIAQLEEAAAAAGLWSELCTFHYSRIEHARNQGLPPPLDALLSAARIHEGHLREPVTAYKLLRRAMPTGPEAPVRATTRGQDAFVLLAELSRLARVLGSGERATEGTALLRDLLGLYHTLVDDLCGQRGAATEETAVRLHQLLGSSARLREEVLSDLRGALEDRLRAFSLGGERDRAAAMPAAGSRSSESSGSTEEADALFSETLDEIRRLALGTGQIKEALQCDARRLDRADTDLRRQQVACDAAAWIDDFVNEPPRALRSCLKALGLCADGSDAQAEMRGRLYRLGRRLGALAWEDISRTERGTLSGSDVAAQRRRLHYIAALWEHGAQEIAKAVEAVGQAYRLAFFPAGDTTQPGEEERAEQADLRAELQRLSKAAPSDGEGPGRVVALLDGIAAQLNESGDTPAAIGVLLDAAQTDEQRGRLPQAERRYQEVLRGDPGCEEALAHLERLYRKQRRLADLAALLERRRNGLLERLPPGPGRRTMMLELGELYQQLGKNFEALDVWTSMAAEDDADPEPHHRIARLQEAQRAYARAAEAYLAEAERALAGTPGAPSRAMDALLRAGELFEKQVNSPERAAAAYRTALQRVRPAAPEDEAEQRALTDRRLFLLAGVQRTLEKLHRFGELSNLLLEILESGVPSRDERIELLGRRIRLLRERLHEEDGSLPDALRAADELTTLLPDDDAALERKEQLLDDLGQKEAGRDVARQRATAAARRDEGAREQAARWVHAARRELQVGHTSGASEALLRATELYPDDLASLQTLADLRRQMGDVPGQIGALTTLAEREQEPGLAAHHLLRAAQVTLHDLGDKEGARRLLQQQLLRCPPAFGAAMPARGSRSSESSGEEAARMALSLLGDLSLEAGEAAAEDHARQELLLGDAVPRDRSRVLHERLGHLLLQRGAEDEALEHFSQALALLPGQLGPTRALCAILTRRGDHARIETLLQEALRTAETDPSSSLSAADRAALLRQQAHASRELGKQQACYDALLLAEQLVPGDAQEQLLLGETAFALAQHEVAARALSRLLPAPEDHDDPGTPLPAAERAEALTHGALSFLSLGRKQEARELLEGALRLSPDLEQAAIPYLDILRAEGAPAEDLHRAESLLMQRAERLLSADPAQAAHLYRQAAKTAQRRGDDPWARELLQTGLVLLSGDAVPATLVEELSQQLLSLARQAGDLTQARESAQRLYEVAHDPAGKARWLCQLAELDLAAGDPDRARSHLLQAHTLAPEDAGVLLQMAPLLPDGEVVSVLGAVLPQLTPPDAGDQVRHRVWSLLAEAQARLGDAAAVNSYDQAIAAAAGLPEAVALGLRRSALAVLDNAQGPRVRQHLGVLLRQDPFDIASLRRLHHLEEESGDRGAAQRLGQILRVLLPQGEAAPSVPPPAPIPTHFTLEEADHGKWAAPAARTLAEIMATLWEGTAAGKAPGIEAFGVSAAERLPPSESSPDEVVRLFAASCRVLGNRRATLYRNQQQGPIVPLLCAHQPTALIISPALGKLPPGETLFLLGRAVELLRPEYILQAALIRGAFPAEISPAPRGDDLTRLFSLATRAFHPRHIRHSTEAINAWRRELPYRAVKRLSDLFKEHADTPFSTATWRLAVRRSANRAGLLLCGDLVAAAAALRHQDSDPLGAEADLRDLIEFWLSPTAVLAEKLHPIR